MTLNDFFLENRKVAIAFSGGVDSAYLLYAATEAGCDVTAYYVKSQFQPLFELDDAEKVVEYIKSKFGNISDSDNDHRPVCKNAVNNVCRMKVIDLDVLKYDDVICNSERRCYFCKQKIFNAIKDAAKADGYVVLLDGTNASDDANDRPGMKALQELSVKSPLRICGITKDEIRQLSRDAGLFTADKPAYACLATRIAKDQKITGEDLAITEKAEGYLFDKGFTDFRIRKAGNTGKIQVKREQLDMLINNREEILAELNKYYDDVIIDMEGLR